MTVGWPPAARPARRPIAILAAFALGVGLVGCEIGFVDRGGSFVADNRSDVAVLARIKKTVSTASGLEAVYEVVEVPATSRVVLAYQGFADPEQINGIEVVLQSCETIGTFFGFPQGGRVILIDDGPTATQVREWPDETKPTANTVDKCPVSEASPSP